MYEFLYESLYRVFKYRSSIQLQKIVTMIIVPPLIFFEFIFSEWLKRKKSIFSYVLSVKKCTYLNNHFVLVKMYMLELITWREGEREAKNLKTKKERRKLFSRFACKLIKLYAA